MIFGALLQVRVLLHTTMSSESNTGIDLLQVRIETLSSKMDRLITIQEKVLSRLDGMSQDIDGIERDVETLKVEKEEIHFPPVIRTGPGHEMTDMCQEMNSIMLAVNQRSEQQTQKLEGMERLVISMQQVVTFIGETVKTSKIMDVIFKGPAARKNKMVSASRSKDNKCKLITKRQASENCEPVVNKVSLQCGNMYAELPSEMLHQHFRGTEVHSFLNITI